MELQRQKRCLAGERRNLDDLARSAKGIGRPIGSITGFSHGLFPRPVPAGVVE
jgi:hypothetical protein